MSEAGKMPARIWAHPSSDGSCVVSFTTPSLDYNTSYIHFDIAEQMAEALRRIECASRKDSLSDRERLQSVRTTACAALSAWEASNG